MALNCWGAGSSGRLGNGTTENKLVPTPVDVTGALAGKQLAAISVGIGHVCAVDTAGQGYCWGDGSKGQMGNGRSNDSLVPVAMDQTGLGGRPLVAVSAGNDFSCGLDSSGAAYCWGVNGSGRLGTGNYARATRPTAVVSSGALAGRTLVSVTTGGAHACALDSAGLAYCWGSSANGQLGTGGRSSSLVPAAVSTAGALAGRTISDLAADGSNTVALVGGAGLAGLPSTPTDLQALAGSRKVTLTWSAASDNGSPITKYVVRVSPSGRTCSTTGQLTCTVGNLNNDTTYSFTVEAENGVGSSTASAAVTATPRAQAGPGPAPSPTANPGGPAPGLAWVSQRVKSRKLIVNWGGVNATSYQVRISKPGSQVKFKAWKTTAKSKIKFKVKRHRVYRFQIVAIGPGGRSQAQTWVINS